VESSSSTPKQTVATSVPKQADRRIPNFLWAGLFILLFVALAAVLYVHYRKKHPWNASR
jgi:hypothetical protein